MSIFRKHDLTKLARRKPGLIEPRINNGTAQVFRQVEQDSREVDQADDVVEIKNEKDYSSSLVAIDAISGEILWSFQDTNNDLWDFDVVGPPVILDLKIRNKNIRTVVAASKTGNIMIFNVRNGKPIFENFYKNIEVPDSDLKNVETSKYQKLFLRPAPISKTYFDPKKDLFYHNSEQHDYLKFKLRNTKFGNYQPPSLNNDVVTFGLHGGPSWPGSSLTNKNNLIIPINEYPWFIRLYYRDKIFSKISLYAEKINNYFNFKKTKEENKFQKNINRVLILHIFYF